MAAETEVCGICLETLHRWEDGVACLTCCGKVMHVACSEELRTSAHGDKCPMCRAPFAKPPLSGLESRAAIEDKRAASTRVTHSPAHTKISDA